MKDYVKLFNNKHENEIKQNKRTQFIRKLFLSVLIFIVLILFFLGIAFTGINYDITAMKEATSVGIIIFIIFVSVLLSAYAVRQIKEN
jgi:hypothetical protein